MVSMANNRDLLFDDWCDPVDLHILRDAEEILAQRAWQDACHEQAQRQAEQESFARALNSREFCVLANVRAFMAISADVAITRRAPLAALLTALSQIVRGLWIDHFVQRVLLLAARRTIPAATPSGRTMPTHCLSPRLLGQRPQTARATRAALMR
jgi:hypothetical protein